MDWTKGPWIVTIHWIDKHESQPYAVFAGKNPLGPQGGRCGNVMDGECLARELSYPDAVRIADDFVAKYPNALLLLTANQAAGADSVREGGQAPRSVEDG